MKYKYISTHDTNPYMNLAVESDLFRYAEKGTTILYLWQNADTIVIGKNQNIYSECKSEEFINDGGKIARRMSGGGAVYHDLGNLNYSIINVSEDLQKPKYQEIIETTMNYLGIRTEYNGRNDLLVHGKKFSGNAFYDNGNVLCQHGTVLISVDIDRMTYYLTPEESKLERNHVKSVSSRVINLNSVLNSITVDMMRKAFIDALNADKMDYVSDRSFIEKQYKKFSSREWIYGDRIK